MTVHAIENAMLDMPTDGCFQHSALQRNLHEVSLNHAVNALFASLFFATWLGGSFAMTMRSHSAMQLWLFCPQWQLCCFILAIALMLAHKQ